MAQRCSLLAAVSGMPLAGWKIISNGLYGQLLNRICVQGGTDEISAPQRLLLMPPFEFEHNFSQLVTTYGMHMLSPFLYYQVGCGK